MSHNQLNQPSVAYSYPPPPASSTAGPYVAPPPAGYPMSKDDANQYNSQTPVETKSKGDGFWKGCCAALCCCCMLDACF